MIQDFPFHPSIIYTLMGMFAQSEMSITTNRIWAAHVIKSGKSEEATLEVIKRSMAHAARVNIIAIRCMMNDMDVPDELRKIYATKLISIAVGLEEDELEEAAKDPTFGTDLLSTFKPSVILTSH